MGRPRFTIIHGFAVSLALHSILAFAFILAALVSEPEEPQTLVLDLQRFVVVGERQVEQMIQQETQGDTQQDALEREESNATNATMAVPSDDQSVNVAAGDKEARPALAPPEPTQSDRRPEMNSEAAGSTNISGAEEQQNAQTIKKDRDENVDRLKSYVKRLTKKVQSKLVYPDEGRHAGLQGIATVSFTILSTGQISPGTLKIIESSGQPKLDTSALKTVCSSAPFDPPPQELTVAIAVAFGRKHP